MKGIGVLQEGIHAPLDLGPIADPEDRIQRKEAVLKENFCEHVQKLHQDKNALFLAEYQVRTVSVSQGDIHIYTQLETCPCTYEIRCFISVSRLASQRLCD